MSGVKSKCPLLTRPEARRGLARGREGGGSEGLRVRDRGEEADGILQAESRKPAQPRRMSFHYSRRCTVTAPACSPQYWWDKHPKVQQGCWGWQGTGRSPSARGPCSPRGRGARVGTGRTAPGCSKLSACPCVEPETRRGEHLHIDLSHGPARAAPNPSWDTKLNIFLTEMLKHHEIQEKFIKIVHYL